MRVRTLQAIKLALEAAFALGVLLVLLAPLSVNA
mgnify:FL=1